MKSIIFLKPRVYNKAVLLLCIFFCGISAKAIPIARVTDSSPTKQIAGYLQEFIDRSEKLTITDIQHLNPFKGATNRNPIYANAVQSVWLKFASENASKSSTLFLDVAYSNISQVTLYKLVNGNYIKIDEGGNSVQFQQYIPGSPDIVLDLHLAPKEMATYIIHVNSKHPIIFPANVSTSRSVGGLATKQTVIISLYLGVLMIMFLYNLFLWYSTKDRNYVYYIAYIFFLGFAQVTAAGYAYRFIWPAYSALNKYAVIWTSTFSAIAGLLFSIYFLQTKYYAPRAHKLFKVLVFIYVLGLILNLFNLTNISYDILNYNSLLTVFAVLFTSIYIANKGFRPAYFYVIAWLALLLSFVVLIIRNLNGLPYNTFTAYVFYIGSMIEVALLSLALADKINIYRKEKELSQAEALKISLENEQLVKEQNIQLERKVAERTEELSLTNDQLSAAFKDLKDAQIQLVEAEKMASLGQLTAGIAHEINNPINFVKSNIKPLTLDLNELMQVIDAYEKLHLVDNKDVADRLYDIERLTNEIDLPFVKAEIYNLLKGIEDGAERTAEIVRGLRTFSRLDESMIKVVNIHEGIDSTLVLLRNTFSDDLEIIRDYKAEGNIECFPGKLNQVFMNILSNGIQAMKSNGTSTEKKTITITTSDVSEEQVEIRIKDTGPGMSAEVKQKIFDPFFTTKDVGEGTGLGLAIVFKIIQEHGGKIEVVTALGEGAEFIITLNHTVPVKSIF